MYIQGVPHEKFRRPEDSIQGDLNQRPKQGEEYTYRGHPKTIRPPSIIEFICRGSARETPTTSASRKRRFHTVTSKFIWRGFREIQNPRHPSTSKPSTEEFGNESFSSTIRHRTSNFIQEAQDLYFGRGYIHVLPSPAQVRAIIEDAQEKLPPTRKAIIPLNSQS
ncbi:hypothetical protein HHI36_001083 [Cryptolaemus montrouzieri]|uniref:Uncharacterized protein n=1 Tax=Cryptolaemus montrouzieri TaxID=559131 RepID=A0ABD2P6L0_9CUCU